MDKSNNACNLLTTTEVASSSKCSLTTSKAPKIWFLSYFTEAIIQTLEDVSYNIVLPQTEQVTKPKYNVDVTYYLTDGSVLVTCLSVPQIPLETARTYRAPLLQGQPQSYWSYLVAALYGFFFQKC